MDGYLQTLPLPEELECKESTKELTSATIDVLFDLLRIPLHLVGARASAP